MNEEQPEVKLDDILKAIKDLEKPINNVNDSTTVLHENLTHLSGQMDILNHSIYVTNEYLMWITISIMCVAAMVMFSVGYILTRK